MTEAQNKPGKHAKNDVSSLRRELDSARQRMAELETELEKAVDIFEGIVDATRDGIMIEDDSGRVSYANNGLVEMLGYKNREEVLHRPWSHFFSLDQEKKIPGARGMYESLLVTRDNRRVPILITSSSFYFKGEYMGVLSVIKDITERKKFEESLARSEKFNAIAQLTMGISHEIKNPLSVLQAHVDLIKNKKEIKNLEDEKILYSLKVIAEQSERIAITVSSLTSLAQDKESLMKPINALELMHNVAEMFHPKLNKSHITLYAEWDPDDIVIIEADEGKLLQVLTNLLFNAIESMSGGGELWLGVDRTPEGVEIRVSDTGIGIPEDLMKRIFDPFFTTKTRGTGMGLAICQGIVEKHGGRMHIESQPGSGTTVRLLLPVKQR